LAKKIQCMEKYQLMPFEKVIYHGTNMLIEIYTKKDCPACQKVKQILTTFGYNYTEYELGRNITREELRRQFPEAKLVPIIIVDNERVDCWNDLQLLLEQK